MCAIQGIHTIQTYMHAYVLGHFCDCLHNWLERRRDASKICSNSLKHDSPNFHAHMMTITEIWCIWCGCTRFSCFFVYATCCCFFFFWGDRTKMVKRQNTLLPEFTSNLYRLLCGLINQHLPYIFKETNQTSTYGNLYAYPCLVRFDHYASFIRFRY